MQRLGAVFIAICMVAISVSVGAILYYSFALSIPEAAPISFGVLLTLLLIHYQISRVRDRVLIDEQMDDLTRLKLGLTKELQDVREMAKSLEDGVSDRMEKEVEPILAELDVIGALVKQLAESCAELDERVQNGDAQVEAVNAKLRSATQSVKELEDLLRASARMQTQSVVHAQPKPQPSRGIALQNNSADVYGEPYRTVDQPEELRSYPQGNGYPPEPPFGMRDDEAANFAPDLAEPEPEPEPEIRPEDETAVRRALALGKIELFMQPIVSLPMRKPLYYEALSRLKTDDGGLITPDIFLPVCRKNNFMPMLDRLAINEAFRLLRRLVDRGRGVDCFCNLSLQSLSDSDFFALMRDLFDKNKDLSEHIILEFSQADLGKFGVLEDETLQLLKSMGFRFSVDKVSDLTGDFDRLSQRGVRYAKIAAPVLTHREAGYGLDIHPADFSRLLSRKGIELIATHVRDETTLVSLIDYSIHLAQGDHFAPAKALKAGAEDMRAIAETRSTPAQKPQAQAKAPVRQSDVAPSRPQASRTIRPEDVPAPRVHGLGDRAQPAREEPQASGSMRPLGKNPKIAEALRMMANQDDGDTATREHFRTVLAEAAGLIEPTAGPAVGRAAPSLATAAPQTMRQAPTPNPTSQGNRLPVSEEFGLNTSTDRGQFIDLSEPAPRPAQPRPRPTAQGDGGNAGDPGRFERLIR